MTKCRERAVDEQKAHIEGPDAAKHKISDVVAGVHRGIGDRGEDRDTAGGEEDSAFAYRAQIGAITKQRAIKPYGVLHGNPVRAENFGRTVVA